MINTKIINLPIQLDYKFNLICCRKSISLQSSPKKRIQMSLQSIDEKKNYLLRSCFDFFLPYESVWVTKLKETSLRLFSRTSNQQNSESEKHIAFTRFSSSLYIYFRYPIWSTHTKLKEKYIREFPLRHFHEWIFQHTEMHFCARKCVDGSSCFKENLLIVENYFISKHLKIRQL